MSRRLLLTYLTFALLILVALEIPLGYVYHRGERREAFGRLEHDAENLAAFVDTAMTKGDRDQVVLLAYESAQRLGGQVDVVDARGQLVLSTHPGRTPGDPADIRVALSGQGRISTRTAMSAGVEIMSIAVPVHPGIAARGAIRVGVPTAPVTSRIRHFWLILAAAGAAVLAAVALIAVALARWISRPVRVLERATRSLADGTLPPPTITGPPELRRLAASFHATATRLHGLIESQRSFAGHASHQLKTPLAALRLRLENLEPDIAPAGGRNLRAAITETDRLAQMVETLLAMARSEQRTLPTETVDLAAAVAGRIFLWSPLAADQHVGLVVSGPDEARVRVVPGAVDQIMDNLLANALRVAPRDSSIAITWQANGPDMIDLHVVDAGPGLCAEHRERAFDPFWRAPGAANGGTGLGLALVGRLAEGGGGRAALRPADGTGIDAVVTFPVSADRPADPGAAPSRSGPGSPRTGPGSR